MRKWWPVALVLALLLAQPLTAQARTWRVERYGPADFSTIQPALDAAAPGDTILIGYGRYTEYMTVTLPGWSWPVGVYAWVRQDNLTIIGLGGTGTVIGPLAPSFHDFGPKGLVVMDDVDGLRVQGVGLENVYDGMYLVGGPIEVSYCRFRGCEYGIAYFGNTALHVRNSTFLDSTWLGNGIWCNNAGQSVLIEDSAFINCYGGVSFGATTDAVVSRCTITGGVGGIQYAGGSTGTIVDCRIEDQLNFNVGIITGSTVTLERNYLSGTARNITSVTRGAIRGSENILVDAWLAAIRCSLCTSEFHGNHIFNGGGYTVALDNFQNLPAVTVDFTGNYWGTDDAGQITAWIWDGHDDPQIHAFVAFEPFADGPVPGQRRSWGEVKELYRTPSGGAASLGRRE